MNAKPKILIVDDKVENLIALEVALKELDVALIRASSGNDALKATLYHDFTLAILDVHMPGMDGFELAQLLREEERTSKLPFIFISAVYTDSVSVFKGYEEGAFSFITKPFQPQILINKVQFFIEKYQQEQELIALNRLMKAKNEELLQINAELDSFSYSISHDLRAPLRAIDGFSKIVMKDYGELLGDEGKKMLETIVIKAQLMRQLIDDLLEFSRIGKKRVKRVEIDTGLLVKEVLSELQTQVTNPVSKVIVKPLFNCYGDKNLIKQVFTNLISNALKYSSKKDNPIVEIGYYYDNGKDVYYVKDNGVGFDMKYYDKLFGVFQRLHSPKDFEGTGVGLSIVNRIINKHNGMVWGEGVPDEGAAFYFSLPEMNLQDMEASTDETQTIA